MPHNASHDFIIAATRERKKDGKKERPKNTHTKKKPQILNTQKERKKERKKLLNIKKERHLET